METTHSFQSHERDSPPSLLPYRNGLVGVVGALNHPPFVVSGTLHGSDGEKADAPSMPLINPGVGSKPSLQFSFMV
jgi:hypothetical protein